MSHLLVLGHRLLLCMPCTDGPLALPFNLMLLLLARPLSSDTSVVVSSLTVRRTKSGPNMFCTADITVRSMPSGVPVANAVVGFRWSSKLARRGWPYTGTSVGTSSTGQVAITANKLPTSGGNGCTFDVTGVSAGSLTYDAAASVTTGSAAW